MVGSLAVPAEGTRLVVVVPVLVVPIRHTISRIFQMSAAHRRHTRIHMPVVALHREKAVRRTAAVCMIAVLAHRFAAAVQQVVAVVHMLAEPGCRIVGIDHTVAAAAGHTVVAAADYRAFVEAEVDRIGLVVLAEGQRKDSAQMWIGVQEVRRDFAVGREKHWVCSVEYEVVQNPDMLGKTY